MSLPWSDIFDLYMSGTGNAPAAAKERFVHVTEGYRGVCGQLEVPELYIPGAEEDTVASQDYIEMDPDVYSMHTVVNKDTGYKLEPEPAGYRGRSRYIEASTGMPPEADNPNYYVRKGNRLWLRDTPNQVVTLLMSFKLHPPAITSSTDITEHPITPPQYDMAIVRWAMGNYFLVHPPITDQGLDVNHGQNLIASAQQLLVNPKSPMADEGMDSRNFTRQLGYDFGIGGR
jgi:hypothetical protein